MVPLSMCIYMATLVLQEVKNLTLPDWVSDAVMEHMLNLTMYTSSLMFNTVTKNQLTAGIYRACDTYCIPWLERFYLGNLSKQPPTVANTLSTSNKDTFFSLSHCYPD